MKRNSTKFIPIIAAALLALLGGCATLPSAEVVADDWLTEMMADFRP